MTSQPVNNRIRFNTAFVNPFFINGFTWLLVLLVYQLRWSTLCPRLSEEMLTFLITTVVISLLCGFLLQKKGFNKFYLLRRVRLKPLWVITTILYILLCIEIIAEGGFPLLSYVTGTRSILYNEFGLPGIHIIVVNCFSAMIIFAYYAYISSQDKMIRKKLRWLVFINFIPYLILFNRAGIIDNLLGVFLMSLLVSKRPILLFVKLIFLGLAILYGFGYMGNLRFGKDKMDMILEVGGITNEFRKSWVPNEFAWGYLYIATPLANTQNTINRTRGIPSVDSENLQNLIEYEFIPGIVSKRLGVEENNRNKAKLIKDDLIVSSVYGRGYGYMGWMGLWIIYIFILLFILVNTKIININSRFYIPMLITLDIIVVMNLFDNMLIFIGLFPQLLIWILLYFSNGRKCLIS